MITSEILWLTKQGGGTQQLGTPTEGGGPDEENEVDGTGCFLMKDGARNRRGWCQGTSRGSSVFSDRVKDPIDAGYRSSSWFLGQYS